MIYYSPGIKFHCPSCNSQRIGFIFEKELKNISLEEKQIHQNKVILSNSKTNHQSKPSWLCYDCYACGNIEKKEMVK